MTVVTLRNEHIEQAVRPRPGQNEAVGSGRGIGNEDLSFG